MFYCEICGDWMDCWNDCENCDIWREEELQNVKFCGYGHIICQLIKDPDDMQYWMPPDPWCEEWCSVWNRELRCCGFANEGDKNEFK